MLTIFNWSASAAINKRKIRF